MSGPSPRLGALGRVDSIGIYVTRAYIHEMSFEHHRQPLASRNHFARRLLKFGGYSAAFLTTFSILIAPILHRILHRLHLNERSE